MDSVLQTVCPAAFVHISFRILDIKLMEKSKCARFRGPVALVLASSPGTCTFGFSRLNICNRLDMAILPSHIGGGCRATSDGHHADGGNGPQQLADSAGQLHEDAKDHVHQMVNTRTISVLLVTPWTP